MSVAIVKQQPALDMIPEEEVKHTPVKETNKSRVASKETEDGHSTDEGTSTPEPSSSCTSDDEIHSGQEADVDSSQSSESGPNSSCTSDDEDYVIARPVSDPIPLAELPSVGSVGHYAGQCSRCCFFPKGRCTNGATCNFCHLDHERVRRKRGGAKKAEKAAEETETAAENPTDEQAVHDPVAKKLDFKEGVTTEHLPCTQSSLQASSEEFVPNMIQTTVANMHAMSMHAMRPVVSAPMPVPQQRIPTPQCTRSRAPPAELLTSKLLAVSSGRPVKVWVPSDVQPLKRLDASIPAKKKPSFPEYASDKKKTLDPSMPCKKHMPSWLLNIDAIPSAPKPKPQTFAPVPPAPVSSVEPAPR